MLSFLSGKVTIDTSGETLTVDCSSALEGGTCSAVTASVDGGEPKTARSEEGGKKYHLTLLPAVTPGNSVVVSATVPVSSPSASSFTLTVRAPLPGAPGLFGTPVVVPTCQGDVAASTFSCFDLVEGAYSVEETGAHTQAVGPFEVKDESGGTFSVPLTALAAGDTVALNYTGPLAPAPRLLTTLHIGTRRADILQPSNSFEGGSSMLSSPPTARPASGSSAQITARCVPPPGTPRKI